MKNIILLLSSLFILNSFSQTKNFENKEDYLDQLQQLEQRSASKKMNFYRNPNTENYDLKYHRLEWNVDPAQLYISGTVTSYFEAKSDMNSITFDLSSNMTVGEVSQRGTVLSFTRTGDEVRITLPTTQNTGVLDSLTVYYYGTPISTGFASFEIATQHNVVDGIPILWTLSEPYGAMNWWPCKQDLTDKIDSIDVFTTHPSQYKTASNGLLQSETVGGASTVTHWKHKYPIPAYLIAIAVTEYAVYTDHVVNGGFDVVNYVYPSDLASVQTATAITPQIMDLFGNLFEMYPFANEKYGHAQCGFGGGMEHTTMTFMGSWSRSLIAHELAHQWFGDKITCGSWEDIWLNEGFATYLNALVIEDFDGENAFKDWRERTILNDFGREITRFPNGSVFVNDTTSVSRIFSSRLSYRKGAMVLHMLRYKLGDTNFFQGVKNYLADPNLAYGYAKTIDLQNHLETASGEDLTEFLNDWFIGEGYPSFNVNWNYNTTTQKVNFMINQTQSDASVSFFETPLPIKVFGSGGQNQILRLELTENDQSFSLPIGFEVTSIAVDPDFQIISKNNTILKTNNLTLEEQILLYPNPVTNDLTIKNNSLISLTKLSIYNMLGQKVLNFENPLETIPLTNLAKGIYTVKLETKKGTLLKTIIKN